MILTVGEATPIRKHTQIKDHGQAMTSVLALLEERDLLVGIEAVGHRVVHGGPHFQGPVWIDSDVIKAVEALDELAPLHNRPALSVIRRARDYLGLDVPMIATFDTAFYALLPEAASIYPLPLQLTAKYSIRRYGFHGLAHRYMVERFHELRPDISRPKLVTLQLGNGCSATASVDGRPIDTSMGFTPLEGLIMGTRSGDLDPSLPLYLAEKEGISTKEVARLLNTESGLLALSERSSDMRDIIEASHQRDSRSMLAVEAFCYRVTKYIGAYLAALGGAHAVVFGGGIGEHSVEVRERIVRGMEWGGLKLDMKLNSGAIGQEARISADSASIEAWVMHVDESLVIARDVISCIEQLHDS
jgi:acetate kinase